MHTALNIIAIRVRDKRTIIPPVIFLPDTRSSIIRPACLQSSCMEFINVGTIPSRKANMARPRLMTLVLCGHEPELRLVAPEGIYLMFRQFKVASIAKRLQEGSVEFFRFGDIFNVDSDVIENVGHCDEGVWLAVWKRKVGEAESASFNQPPPHSQESLPDTHRISSEG